MNNNIIKSDSFIKHDNILFSNKIYKNKDDNKYINKENKENKKYTKFLNVSNSKKINNSILEHQDYILDMLIELRNFDETNGTKFFKNLSYNTLNTFILKNTF